MKMLCFLAIGLAAPFLLTAQEREFECIDSALYAQRKPAEVMESVQKAYAGISSLKADFVQNSYLAALEMSELSSGQVWFQRPGKMRWHYSQPEEQIFVVKDGTMWFYQEREKQVTVDSFEELVISDLPVSFLLGMGDLKKDFRLVRLCQNPGGLVLELARVNLKPSEKSELKTLKLLVNPDSYLPQGALVTDVGDNVTSIILSKLDLNPQVADALFDSNFGAGLDLIDRREERKRL